MKRSWTRLSEEARADVATRYETGDTTTQLAEDFDVAKSTIIGTLRERKIVMRRQSLSTEQVSEAARL